MLSNIFLFLEEKIEKAKGRKASEHYDPCNDGIITSFLIGKQISMRTGENTSVVILLFVFIYFKEFFISLNKKQKSCKYFFL